MIPLPASVSMRDTVDVREAFASSTLPITVVTLGLFYLVVNGLCFGLAAWVSPGFQADSFTSAILGALVLSAISWLFGLFLRSADRGHP